MESHWEVYRKLPNFKELEKIRKKALKMRAWLWWNYNDEEMITDFRWLGRWKRPTKERIKKIDIYLKKKI